jgi:hypothetical protein
LSGRIISVFGIDLMISQRGLLFVSNRVDGVGIAEGVSMMMMLESSGLMICHTLASVKLANKALPMKLASLSSLSFAVASWVFTV